MLRTRCANSAIILSYYRSRLQSDSSDMQVPTQYCDLQGPSWYWRRKGKVPKLVPMAQASKKGETHGAMYVLSSYCSVHTVEAIHFRIDMTEKYSTMPCIDLCLYGKGRQHHRSILQDVYVKQSNVDNYRSRSAYKLIELDDKFHFLKKGSIVVNSIVCP